MKASFSKVAGLAVLSTMLVGERAFAGPKDDVSFSNVKVEIREGMKRDGKKYPKISLDVLVNKKLAKSMSLTVKATCLVGGKKMTDKGIAMAQWDDVEPEETKQAEMAPFVSHNLESDPETCEFSVRWGKLLGEGKELGKYCWAAGSVTDGACPKAK